MEDTSFARQTVDEEIMRNHDNGLIDNEYLQSKKSGISVGNKKRESIHLYKTGNKQSATTTTKQAIKNNSLSQEDPRDLDSVVRIKKEIKASEDKRKSDVYIRYNIALLTAV